MFGRSKRGFSDIGHERKRGFLENIYRFVKSLPGSDKLVLFVLFALFLITSLTALVALERRYMVEVPIHGGSLSGGEVGTPRFINPLLAITDADRDLTTLTYAGLMGVGPNGLTPVLAESYTVSPDGKVYTFTIRKNAKFSDGTPVTADDVVFTVEKAQDPALKSPEFANWASVRAEAVDASTVRFTLSKAYAPFIEDTTLGILPMHTWKDVADGEFPFSKLLEHPVGAGPFRVTHVSHDSSGAITQVNLAANGSYALGRPYLDTMTLKFYSGIDELMSAYHNGSVESAYGIPVMGALTAPYSRVFGVFLNQTKDKAFARPEVRKALSLAVDRDHIVNTILGGYGAAALGPVPAGSGITEPALPSGDRVALAKQTLTNAGWTYNASTTSWSNKTLKLTLGPVIIATSNTPELKTLVSSIESDWEAIGVSTSLEYHDPTSLLNDVIRPRAYDALFFGMVVGRETDLYPFWDSSQKADPGLNVALYANKTVDDLIEKARTETDPAKRLVEIQQASDDIAADYPVVFTHSPDFVFAVPKDLKGVVLPQITMPSDRFATVATWYRHSAFVWPFLAR